MRPQQNRRMRGRGNNNNNNNNGNNNNRKGPNPLTRSYESNGPDVKIRGTAQQIAEKYTTLARDAQSSGDRVMAENYLQHAEHYNRIIATALAQQAATQQQQRDQREDDDEDSDGNDAGFDGGSGNQGQRGDQNQQPRDERQNRDNRDRDNRGNREPRENRDGTTGDGSGPQPVIDGVPAEVALHQDDETPTEGRRQRAPRRERAPRAEQTGGEGDVTAVSSPAQLAASVQSAEAAGDDEGARKPRRPRRPRLKAGENESAATADDKSDDVGEAAA